MMIVGIDEVGRGCWAGPLVAGAVILSSEILGLKDSKKLTRLQRERLAQNIKESGSAIGLGWVTATEVDTLGLTAAVQLAMERALKQITQTYDQVIIDGNLNFLQHLPNTTAIIKADDSVPAVSAASIVAKVARDNYMTGLGAQYQKYEFAKHVGYGTALHRQHLMKYGVSDQHRRSFKPVKALLQ